MDILHLRALRGYKCKSILENNIFSCIDLIYFCCMWNRKLEQSMILIFNRPPKILHFWFLFGVFTIWALHIFLGKLFLFFTKWKNFKIQQVYFSGRMSLWIAQQLLSCWKTLLCSLKYFSEPQWWWDKILSNLAYGSKSGSVYSWTWAGVAACKCYLLEEFINHLICS